MQYIVLNKQQYEFFMNLKKDFEPLMLSRSVNVQPIEIKNEQFILNTEVLNDDGFKELKQALIDGGHLDDLLIRAVNEDEFLQSEI